MQEGTLSLMQLAKVSVCVEALHRAGIPYVSILTDPTYGGVPASYAMQSDTVIECQVPGDRICWSRSHTQHYVTVLSKTLSTTHVPQTFSLPNTFSLMGSSTS